MDDASLEPRRFKPLRRWLLRATALAVVGAGAVWAGAWLPLAQDGLHDPSIPDLHLLQEPAEALSKLPPDAVGDRVNWVKALEEGHINPRTNIHPETRIEVLDQDILMRDTGELPMVRFPHKQHTEWLDCGNCHEELFKSKAGATPVNMLAILQGEYCGRCHGAVAFPLTECNRCHNAPRTATGAAEAR